MRLLIVEDEGKGAEFLRKGLTESGFIVGVFRALNVHYDLVILDAMLPGRMAGRYCRNCGIAEAPFPFCS